MQNKYKLDQQSNPRLNQAQNQKASAPWLLLKIAVKVGSGTCIIIWMYYILLVTVMISSDCTCVIHN